MDALAGRSSSQAPEYDGSAAIAASGKRRSSSVSVFIAVKNAADAPRFHYGVIFISIVSPILIRSTWLSLCATHTWCSSPVFAFVNW